MGAGPGRMRLVRDKIEDDGEIQDRRVRIRYGGSEMQGWRPYQEDRRAVYYDSLAERGLVMFAVFDGHGGSRTAEVCSKQMGPFLWDRLARGGGAPSAKLLVDCFAEFDWMLCSMPGERHRHMSCGTTATLVLVDTRAEQLWVAHTGDSRAVIYNPAARQLSYVTKDHAPDEPEEQLRISSAVEKSTSALSAVTMRGNRVFVGGCSSLNVCRGLGDHDFKRVRSMHQSEQAVTSVPEVYSCALPRAGALHVVVASDGLWGATFTGSDRPAGLDINTQVMNFFAPAAPPYSRRMSEAFDRLVARDLPEMGKSTDNMSGYLIEVSLRE